MFSAELESKPWPRDSGIEIDEERIAVAVDQYYEDMVNDSEEDDSEEDDSEEDDSEEDDSEEDDSEEKSYEELNMPKPFEALIQDIEKRAGSSQPGLTITLYKILLNKLIDKYSELGVKCERDAEDDESEQTLPQMRLFETITLILYDSRVNLFCLDDAAEDPSTIANMLHLLRDTPMKAELKKHQLIASILTYHNVVEPINGVRQAIEIVSRQERKIRAAIREQEETFSCLDSRTGDRSFLKSNLTPGAKLYRILNPICNIKFALWEARMLLMPFKYMRKVMSIISKSEKELPLVARQLCLLSKMDWMELKDNIKVCREGLILRTKVLCGDLDRYERLFEVMLAEGHTESRWSFSQPLTRWARPRLYEYTVHSGGRLEYNPVSSEPIPNLFASSGSCPGITSDSRGVGTKAIMAMHSASRILQDCGLVRDLLPSNASEEEEFGHGSKRVPT